MRRVLVPGGRVALNVWARIEGNPGFAALVEALERHVGVEAANNRRAPFALADRAQIKALLTAAGFRDIWLDTRIELARFSAPEEFVAAQLAGTPLSTLGAPSAETQQAIVDDVRAALRAHLSENGVTLPMEVHLALAYT
jgi:hypothetical protein